MKVVSPGAPQGILGPMKKKNIISISFSIFGGPCQSGALGIVLTFPRYTAPMSEPHSCCACIDMNCAASQCVHSHEAKAPIPQAN